MPATLALVAAVTALPCAGQSLLAPRPCSEASTLRSTSGTAETSLTFDNASPHDVQIWWTDDKGTSVKIVDLNAGESVPITTNREAAFVVRTVAGTCVGVYAATLSNAAVRLTQALFAESQIAQPAVDADDAAEPVLSLDQAIAGMIVRALEQAGVDPGGVELDVRSVRTFSGADVPERQRVAFSIGYTVAQIQADAADSGGAELAARLDRLLASLQPSEELRQAAARWSSARAADGAVTDLAAELQRALEQDVSDRGPPDDVFAQFGALAYVLQLHAQFAFELNAKDALYRVTQQSQYLDEAEELRPEVADGRTVLPRGASAAARACRRVVSATLCREDIAAAFDTIGALIDAERDDDAERALQPIIAEFLIR